MSLFNENIDLSAIPTQTGIVFRHDPTGQEAFIAVTDKFPQLGDMHIEGRRVVEVSVEHYIELAAASGWAPIVPGLDDEGTLPEMLAKEEETTDGV